MARTSRGCSSADAINPPLLALIGSVRAATWPLAQMGVRLPKLPFRLRAERASLWHGLSPGVVRPTVHALLCVDALRGSRALLSLNCPVGCGFVSGLT